MKILLTGVAGLAFALFVFAFRFLRSTRTNMDPNVLQKEALEAIAGAGGATGLRKDADQLLSEHRAALKAKSTELKGPSWISLSATDLTNYPALVRLAQHQGTLVRGIFDGSPSEFSLRILTPGGRLFFDFPDQTVDQKPFTNENNIEVAPGIIVHR